MKRAVVLDRDGTLIDFVRDVELGAVVSAFHPSQLRLLPGVLEGLTALQNAGFVLAIATNQPGPAKGQIPREAVTRTNDALVALLAREGIAIEAVAVCLHHPEGGPGGEAALAVSCDCRKPRPGLLLELRARLGFVPEASWMVGDSAGDIEAGAAAGLRTGLLFPRGRCELCPLVDRPPCVGADLTATRFDEMANAIVERGK